MSENGAIIFSVFTLGMLTQITYVFSVACFFCYLFCSLIADFLELHQLMKEGYKEGVTVGRVVKIMGHLIIIALFISYWADGEYFQ